MLEMPIASLEKINLNSDYCLGLGQILGGKFWIGFFLEKQI